VDGSSALFWFLVRFMKRLLIAADVDASFRAAAASDGRFDVVERPVTTEDELVGVIGDAEIVVTRSYNRVSRRVIDAAPRLELIAQGTSGTDNIDISAAAGRGIAVLNLPGANANGVAELVIGFLIGMTRTVPAYTLEMTRGIWHRADAATRHELAHYSLGIIGLGEVGRRVARLARAFGMRPGALDPFLSDDMFEQRGAARVTTLPEILACDIVSLHVPLTAETRGMIGAGEIASMRKGSFLVNASRGEVLDQRAALDALSANHLAGLALDVFDPEPPPGGFPDDPRLILTPHIGGGTYEAKSAIGAKLYEKIVAYFA
jgi:D-3-phosphoglycerate dehydrogenase / 2-oxoglutarate reductase